VVNNEIIYLHPINYLMSTDYLS